MKKLILVSLFSLLFIPLSANASGACSAYGGVNCAVIFNGGGQLVCSYGQTVMPVSYVDIEDCFAGLGCTASQVDTLMQQYNVPSFYQGVVSSAQYVVDKQNEAQQWESKAMSGDPLAMGQQGVQNSYNATMWGNAEDAVKYALQAVPLAIGQLETQTRQVATACKNVAYQQPTCPANAYLLNGQCSCNDGYVASGSSCITYTQSCQNQYGANSYGDKNNCYCNVGYQWNGSKTACVVLTCPNNASLIGSQCLCNNGYVQNGNTCITYTQDCINSFGQNVHGTKGDKNNSSCDCNTGYQWNSQQTACVVSPTSDENNPAPVVLKKADTTSIQNTINQGNQNQGNYTQNNTEENKKVGADTAGQKAGFFGKIFNSIKNFFSNLFK